MKRAILIAVILLIVTATVGWYTAPPWFKEYAPGYVLGEFVPNIRLEYRRWRFEREGFDYDDLLSQCSQRFVWRSLSQSIVESKEVDMPSAPQAELSGDVVVVLVPVEDVSQSETVAQIQKPYVAQCRYSRETKGCLTP